MNNQELQYKAKLFDQNPKAAMFFETVNALQALREVKTLLAKVDVLEKVRPSEEEIQKLIYPLLPTDEYLTNLIAPLIPEAIPGHTPTADELEEIIVPLISQEFDLVPYPTLEEVRSEIKSKVLPLMAPLATYEEVIQLIDDNRPVIPEMPIFPTTEEIVSGINLLPKAIKASAVDGMITVDDVITELKNPKSKNRLKSQDIDINMNDMRWHGGGISSVITDATLTGNGTSLSPLSVVGGGGGVWYQDEIVATGTTGTSFTLAHTPTTVVFLFKNGQYLVSGVGQDYTRSGTSITLAVSLLSTDILTANYQ